MRSQILSDAHFHSQTPTLLAFSHLRWNFVFQRPQHLLSRAARDARVIFWEEPIFEEGVTPSLRKAVSLEGVRVVVPLLPTGLSASGVENAQRHLLKEFIARSNPAALTTWYYTPMALKFSAQIKAGLCVYDCMDELSAFKGASPELRALEAELFSRADLVFTGGQSLFEAKRDSHDNIHSMPSSIDAAHFGKARRWQGSEPADQAGFAGPRIGFFAVIDERLDIALLERTAVRRPDWQFVILGPVVKIDPRSLPKRPNLHWLGAKAYAELPAYLAGWDAGFMPFALNESTRFISPTKTPEFLAAGVPVVSTAIADVVEPYGTADLVEIATDATEAVDRLDFVLRRPRQPWLRQVDAQLATTSWDKTWNAMQLLMRKARCTLPAVPLPAAEGSATMDLEQARGRQFLV